MKKGQTVSAASRARMSRAQKARYARADVKRKIEAAIPKKRAVYEPPKRTRAELLKRIAKSSGLPPPKTPTPTAKTLPAEVSSTRRFVLNRAIDGAVLAEGIQFANGQAVLHWFEGIHVYAARGPIPVPGGTTVKWVDP